MHNMKPAHTAKREMKLSMPAVKRLLAYLKQYKAVLVIVTVCILLSAGATAASSLFLQVLIDHYIMPLLAETDFFNKKTEILCNDNDNSNGKDNLQCNFINRYFLSRHKQFLIYSTRYVKNTPIGSHSD